MHFYPKSSCARSLGRAAFGSTFTGSEAGAISVLGRPTRQGVGTLTRFILEIDDGKQGEN